MWGLSLTQTTILIIVHIYFLISLNQKSKLLFTFHIDFIEHTSSTIELILLDPVNTKPHLQRGSCCISLAVTPVSCWVPSAVSQLLYLYWNSFSLIQELFPKCLQYIKKKTLYQDSHCFGEKNISQILCGNEYLDKCR